MGQKESKKKPAVECLTLQSRDEPGSSAATSLTDCKPCSNEPVFGKDTCHKPVPEKPTLLKLKKMKGADGEPLKIVQKIAAHDYTTFGMCLLQDGNGEDVTLLKKRHIYDGPESVTEAILQKWLTSDAPTRTYGHLIECLRQSELGALAELIVKTIVHQGMFANCAKSNVYHLMIQIFQLLHEQQNQ